MRSTAQFRVSPIITASEVMNLKLKREALSALKMRISTMEDQVDGLESNLLSRLDEGAYSEVSLQVKVTERRYPAWKERYVELAGADAAQCVLEGTKPTVSRSLIIPSE